jgi:hypothetical protein
VVAQLEKFRKEASGVKGKKPTMKAGFLIWIKVKLSHPVLIAEELGQDGNFEVFALISEDGRPEHDEPQDRVTDGKDNRDGKDQDDDPQDDIQRQCLNGMEADEGAVLFAFNEKHDKGNDKDRVAQGGPKFVITGNAGSGLIHLLLRCQVKQDKFKIILQRIRVKRNKNNVC